MITEPQMDASALLKRAQLRAIALIVGMVLLLCLVMAAIRVVCKSWDLWHQCPVGLEYKWHGKISCLKKDQE